VMASRIRNRSDLSKLSERELEQHRRALAVVAAMRSDPGLSLSRAAASEGTTSRAVHRYAGDALEREGRRWRTTSGDRLYRPMVVYSGGSIIDVDVRGSRKASQLSAYHLAVRHYLDTGDDEPLARFRGKSVGRHEYETDPDVLDEMARRRQLDIESIYRLVA
jgi:hypothetical protein